MANPADVMHGTCWTADRADSILRSVALANNVPEFLAVHQPIRDFQISTTTGHSIEPSDEGLLADLSNPDTRHAFCVVEGEPGAGKSHLIRWLEVKWPDGDLVMLIERADGSLTGTLRQLRDKLGQKYAHLFANLAQSVEATFDGRVKLFHANLAASLSPTFFTNKLGDEDWCGMWELERLIGNPTVQERWSGPTRILNVMSGDGGQRNSASASFDLDDIMTLSQVQLAAEGLPPRAMMLMRKLKKECDRIAPARAERSSHDLLMDEDLEIPEARRLLGALNQRRDFAVQPILGITVDGLRDMFLKLRKALLAEQRRLVLLLEDVTSWEGIDGQLIDSLAVDARTRSDVCDMISVVGMTPLYFKDIQGNYAGRISHVLRLGRQRQSGGFQQTIQLATADAQTEFASRYLRAVRIEKPVLDDWFAAGANPDAVPNKCAGCSGQQPCFAAFGDENGIGLFPFNRNAITNMFEALEDSKGSQSLQTPRGMIQGVLSPVLLNPTRLDAGEFPPVEIEFSEWMPERRLKPSGFMAQIIDAAEPDVERRAQLRRLAILWGDASQDITLKTDANGQREVTGIAEGIFEAFGLPWLGTGLDETPGAAPTGPIPTRPQNDDAATDGLVTGPMPTPAPAPVPAPTQSPGAKPLTGKTATPSVSPTKLKSLADQAQAWRDGKTVGDPTAWEQLLQDLMGDVRELLADPAAGLWERVFTKDLVKLEGSGKTDSRHFVIPREEWATRGLEAYLLQRQGAALQAIQRETNMRAIARMLRRMAELARAQLDRRLVMEPDTWSIPGAIAQLLLARAWLRGAISPTEPLSKQFQELLSTEQDPRSMPSERVDSWGDLIKSTDYWHDKFRSLLRTQLSLPLGTGEPLYDAGLVARQMAEMRKTLRTIAVPAGTQFSRGLEELGKLADLAAQTDAALRHIPAREAKSLTDRRDRVLALLRGSTLKHHIGQIDDVLNQTGAALAQAGPVERQDYFNARRKIEEGELLNESSDAWTTLCDYLLSDDIVFEDEAGRLGHTLAVPIVTLRHTLEALERAETAVRAVFKFAHAYVESNQSDGDLTVVQEFGTRLAEAASNVRSQLEEAA